MLSRFIRGFLLSQEVTQASGFLVGFGLHRYSKALSQFDQLGLTFEAQRSPGTFADVALPAMNPVEQRLQAGTEDIVVMRTAQTAGGAKLHVPDAAGRTGQPGQLIRQGADVLA